MWPFPAWGSPNLITHLSTRDLSQEVTEQSLGQSQRPAPGGDTEAWRESSRGRVSEALLPFLGSFRGHQ